jgi:hypothetical protein
MVIYMKNVIKFIVLWFLIIVCAICMPILTLFRIEVKMKLIQK